MHDNTVAAIAIFCIFGLPIVAWTLFRVFNFVERMELIKRGIVPPPNLSGRRAREWARMQQQGGGWAGSPWQQQAQTQQTVTPPPAYGPVAYDDAQSALFKGIRLSLIGLAIVIGMSFLCKGPWLLAGLVPMFVGIAQVIIALLSGAQLPGVSGSVSYVPPPNGPVPPPGVNPQPPPGSSSAPWAQPGRPHVEELSKPIQPPDVR